MTKLEIRERIFEILEETEFLTTEELAEVLTTEIAKWDMEEQFDEEIPDDVMES